MHIVTDRLLIRDFRPGDRGDLYEILGDEDTMKFSEPPYDLEKTEKFLMDFCIGQGRAVAAALRESGKVIGYILFSQYGMKVYEMGWFFHRAYRGQGYVAESCRAVAEYAFREMAVHKIFAETINPSGSESLLRKLGMGLEGVQRSQCQDLEGRWVDLYLYGRVANMSEDCIGNLTTPSRSN